MIAGLCTEIPHQDKANVLLVADFCRTKSDNLQRSHGLHSARIERAERPDSRASTKHSISLQQVERWLAGATTNPNEASWKEATVRCRLSGGLEAQLVDGAVELRLDLARATELRRELLLHGLNEGFQSAHARRQPFNQEAVTIIRQEMDGTPTGGRERGSCGTGHENREYRVGSGSRCSK